MSYSQSKLLTEKIYDEMIFINCRMFYITKSMSKFESYKKLWNGKIKTFSFSYFFLNIYFTSSLIFKFKNTSEK